MEVFLPARFERTTMYQLIEQVIDTNLQPKGSEIVFNFNSLGFIEPVGVTVLSNLIEWLFKREVKVFFRSPNRNFLNNKNCSISYLDDSLFFKRYVGVPKFQLASPRATTIPLETVSYHESHQWLSKTMFWLSNRLQITTQSLVNIKVCFEEIFNNIYDHSSEKIGCVFAQHYPYLNTVRIAISDFGVGIPVNVRQIHPWINDGEALRAATIQGFTTKSTPKNRGAGLDTLIYNVVNNNKGNVYIHSNYGILNCAYTGTGIALIPENVSGFYPGTLFDIVLRTDTIENIDNSEEEFEW